jgi:hypothetical protein|tara:strand:+ start:45 stop:521 length:477 start_codon:yes stop_codon:yes gene_type:complete
MKIINNFLPESDFKKIQTFFLSSEFPYFFNEKVANENESTKDFYFTHTLYDNNVVNSDHFHLVKPLLEKLDIWFLRRVKVNCYTRTEKLIKHEEHQDLPFSHNGAILSLNTCDGGTFINNKFVKSEENRIVLFDPFIFHSSTNCTDQQARFNININWK